jgi:hypothetical protein
MYHHEKGSDTVIPHKRMISGMAERHSGSASAQPGCSACWLASLSSRSGYRDLSGLGDGDESARVCSEGARAWVVGEGGASGAQVVDQLSCPRRRPAPSQHTAPATPLSAKKMTHPS